MPPLANQDHIFVPSAKWLVGIIGALISLLLLLSVYVWQTSLASRDKVVDQLNTTLSDHTKQLSEIRLDIERRCPHR